MSTDELKGMSIVFYVIRNDAGQFYKTRTSSRRARWVDELSTARIYGKESMARAKVTTYANENPKKPVPEIVEMHVIKVIVVDQKDRVADAQVKKLREEAEHAAVRKKRDLEDAAKQFDEARKRLERLKRGQ